MEEMQYRSAPTKLFAKPFPTEKNPFKVGQKLEGIDPEHEALFCVMTVVQVCGNYKSLIIISLIYVVKLIIDLNWFSHFY